MQKEDNDWVKKCTECEVEGARPRGRPKKTWTEIVEKDHQVRGLNREDAMVNVSSVCVCVCVCVCQKHL